MWNRIFFFFITLTLSSCAILEPTEPPLTNGLYGPDPVSQNIPGSSAQALIARQVAFSSEEVYEATKQVFLREGYKMDLADPHKYMISGSYFIRCEWLCCGVTLVVYIKQISPAPETKLHVLMDSYDFSCDEEDLRVAATVLASNVESILAVY